LDCRSGFLVVRSDSVRTLTSHAFRFHRAETVPLQLQWAAVTFACLLVVMFVKLWCWLEIHTNRVLRELKRVELLLITRPPQP